MKKLYLMLLALLLIAGLGAKLDLNTASLAELRQLPISEAQARDIYHYRLYVSKYSSIYDLRQISSIDQRTLDTLKPLVLVSLVTETDDIAARRDEIRELLERLDSSEGSAEGMGDVWEDF
ncbi:MAG: helix-hairpin-helix domain-containing protein, partial [Candidatus Cloacimonetes bacterium]|nr:helix-hairpin-helix domain-containing protein [Candidatus Cloacimonadota bacterium]